MAHSVAARRRELGIRLALGAQPATLGWMVIREALLLCAGGLAAGLAGSLAAARLVRGMLYGVGATDPFTFGAVCVLLTVVMVAAAIPPARRSLRADPLESLKLE
jgi:ABC-type antimicrobial peptide transport system permease subunit